MTLPSWIGEHQPGLPAFGPLALALAALLAAWLARRQIRSLHSVPHAAHRLRDKISGQRSMLHTLTAQMAAVKPVAAVSPRPQRSPATSEMEERLYSVQDFLELLLTHLERWSTAADLPLSQLSGHAQQMQRLGEELARPSGAALAPAAEGEIRTALPELVRLLVTRSDRDVDPARTNAPLQQALGKILAAGGYQLIDPQVHEPFELLDPRIHLSLGVFQRGTPQQRGRVGRVLCRGLERRGEDILLRAEVLEFD